MALIELTPDDLCAMASFPFPCEEGTIIDPISVAHRLGLVETSAATLEPSDDAAGPSGGRRSSGADPRLVLLSLACSLEVSEAGTRSGAGGASTGPSSLDAFVDGAIASPPTVTTALPRPGSKVVVGTTTFTMPDLSPASSAWGEGEPLTRAQLLALAARLLAASKGPGAGAAADTLAAGATRLIDAAATR